MFGFGGKGVVIRRVIVAATAGSRNSRAGSDAIKAPHSNCFAVKRTGQSYSVRVTFRRFPGATLIKFQKKTEKGDRLALAGRSRKQLARIP